jgi:hypothetical protein
MTGAYNASKFALEAIADAWRLELRTWGIEVILVEPAMTDTDLWRKAPETLEAEAAEMSADHRELYAEHLDGMRKTVPRMQKMAKPVDTVAAAIEKALTAARPRARYPVGADVRVQAALSGVTPDRVKDAAFGRLTGTPTRKRGQAVLRSALRRHSTRPITVGAVRLERPQGAAHRSGRASVAARRIEVIGGQFGDSVTAATSKP